MLIHASSVSVRIGTREILSDVDVTVRSGELVALVGPNGAGKTTLLRTLAGLQAPSGGSVLYGGHDVRELSTRERARTVSYLAQDGGISSPLRVSALVGLGRLPRRDASAAENAAAIRRALAATDTGALADRSVDTLSGGERARVLHARALADEAPLLLADEPFAALDTYHQLRLVEIMRTFAGKEAAAVVVMHDLTMAYRFCDRLVLLADGRKIADGRPDTVLTDGNLATHFGIRARRDRDCLVPWERLSSPTKADADI